MKHLSENPIIERNVHCPYCGSDEALLISAKTVTTISPYFPAAYGLKFLLRTYFYGIFYVFIHGWKWFDISKKRTYTTYGFCPKCGNSYSANPSVSTVASAEDKLYKVRENKVVTGLCRGLSEYTGVPLLWVRIVTVCQFFTIIGAFLYFIVAACVPYIEDVDAGVEYDRKFKIDDEHKLITGICKGIADYTGLPVFWVRVLCAMLTPTIIFPVTYAIISILHNKKIAKS